MVAMRKVVSRKLGLREMHVWAVPLLWSLYLPGIVKHKSRCYLYYVCSWLLFSYVLLNMTIGLSITFHSHDTSLVEERAQYHRSGDFSLARGTSDILIAIIVM